MKKLIKPFWLIFVSLTIGSCANAGPSKATAITKCTKDTPQHPVSYMYVLTNQKGIPINVLTFKNSKRGEQNLNDSKLKLKSVLKSGHKAHRKDIVCWRAVTKDPSTATGYRLTNQPIALLWSPERRTKFKEAVEEKIPANSPLDVAYKYTIATKASKPDDGSTYLDPRLVIRTNN